MSAFFCYLSINEYIEQPKKSKKDQKNEKRLPKKATITAVNDLLYNVFIFSK